MSTYQQKINDASPVRVAGETPAARTYSMVTDAIESGDIEAITTELLHTRTHYQSLEYILTGEETIVKAVEELVAEGAIDPPETLDDALRLMARFYNTVVLEEAYRAAHMVSAVMAAENLTDVNDAVKHIFSHLDHTDHERERLIEDELQRLLNGGE